MYQIKRYQLETGQVLNGLAYSMRVEVESSDEEAYPSKIFVYHAEQPGDETSRAWFEAVASPSQLEELPEDAPSYDEEETMLNPFFRLNYLEAVERSPALLEDFFQELVAEVSALHADLVTISIFSETPVETVEIS